MTWLKHLRKLTDCVTGGKLPVVTDLAVDIATIKADIAAIRVILEG